MLPATATVAGGEAGKEASLNRVDLIQKVLKIVKTGVSLLEALCTGDTFSVTLNGPAFAFVTFVSPTKLNRNCSSFQNSASIRISLCSQDLYKLSLVSLIASVLLNRFPYV